MNRIISQKYLDRLKDLRRRFSLSPNLSCLLDFFESEVLKDQGKGGRKIFKENSLLRVNDIKSSVKLKDIYSYIEIIANSFKGRFLHIHINEDLTDDIRDNLITLLVWKAFSCADYKTETLQEEFENLIKKNKQQINLPATTSKNLINPIFKQRSGDKHREKIIEMILNLHGVFEEDGVLINLNKTAENCVFLSEFSSFPEPLNLFLNFGKSGREVFGEMGVKKTSRLSVVLNLFPSFTGKNIWYKDFIRDEISRYTNFKKVITITSGEKSAMELYEMQRQNKFQSEEIYTIFSFEI
jgi:hypothetical protein